MTGTARLVVRVAAGVGAAMLYFVAVAAFVGAYDIESQFKKAKGLPESSFAVDFSKKGIYEGQLDNGYMTGHSRPVYLQVEPGPADVNMLAGLRARPTLKAENGTDGDCSDIDANNLYYPRTDRPDRLEIAHAFPYDIGRYKFIIEVVTPASGLAGRSQQIVVGYRFCGLELMGSRFLMVIGIVLAAIAVAITVWVVRGGRKRVKNEK